MSCSEDERDDFGAAEEHSILHDEEEPEDVISDLDEVPKSKKKKKAKKSSRESRSSKRQRPIREWVTGGWCLSPVVYRREAGYTLDRLPVHHSATQRHTGQTAMHASHTLIHT
ncbi:hypothetical protein ILYODFUR_034039 [Ilyodon furcidens]|uniref:Uncharacterized protein n=1 Tax=Ilyodon furcidens TaxID=33524 RepID=A0ABV0TQX6_9TELE